MHRYLQWQPAHLRVVFKVLIFSHTGWNVWNHYLWDAISFLVQTAEVLWLDFPLYRRRELLAGCSVQGHQDSGSCYLNLAPICRNLATFWWKDICLRVFLERAEDIFANWWKGYVNSYGTGYSNADEILFYHIYMSRKKSGKPVGQSFVTVTASKAGLDVVEAV